MAKKDFTFDIEGLGDLEHFLNQFKTKDVVQAGRRAINRTVVGVRQKSLNEIRKGFNIKERDLRKRMDMQKAQGNSLGKMEGSVGYSEKPIDMMSFVKGSKDPIKQKGIPVKKRRKLKVEIRKGQPKTLKKAFIQKSKTGGSQVFKSKRAQGKGNPTRFKKQGTRSVASMVNELGYGNKFTKYAGRRFEREFLRELQTRAKGIVKSAKYGNKK